MLKLKAINCTCYQTNLNLCRAEDGPLKYIGATESAWYVTYIEAPDLEDDKLATKFWRRF